MESDRFETRTGPLAWRSSDQRPVTVCYADGLANGGRAARLGRVLRRRRGPARAADAASGTVTGLDGPAGAAEQAIGSYLAQIAARLDGPAGARRDIVAELGTGVADAAEAHRCAGLDPAQAARAAIAEFGSPARVAAGFRSELVAATVRRITLALTTASALTGALWYLAALASHIHQFPAGARLATLVAAIAVATAIGSYLFTLACTGRLTRWLPARPAASAAIAAGSGAAGDAAMLAALTILAADAPGRLAALPFAVASAASIVRFGIATRAARTCLAIRAPSPRIGG